jgi:hypothetical protein
MSARHNWHENWALIGKYFIHQEVRIMNKHLQQKQIFDLFFNEEDLPEISGEEPCPDPDHMNDEQIYDIIDHKGYGEINMNELELDDYDDFIQL